MAFSHAHREISIFQFLHVFQSSYFKRQFIWILINIMIKSIDLWPIRSDNSNPISSLCCLMKLHVDKNNININKSQTGKFCFQISTFFRSRSGSDACENKLYGLMPVGLKPNNHKFNFPQAHHNGLGEGIYVSLSKFSIFM